MNAVIVHGMPSKIDYLDADSPCPSNSDWIPWLQNRLIIGGIPAATPEMPLAYKPNYEMWKTEFERFDISEGTHLVGHSCGAGFLVRWLSENRGTRVAAVVLVAPWLDPFREDTDDFFEFVIDPSLEKRTRGIYVFDSNTDSEGVHASVKSIRDSVSGLVYRQFSNYGHFKGHEIGQTFPELLSVIMNMHDPTSKALAA